MKKLGIILSVTALAALSSVAHAGGPAKANDEAQPVVVREGSSSSAPTGSLFSLGGGGGVLAAATIAGVLFSVGASSGSHGSNVN